MRPATAARAAITRPAPNSHVADVATVALPLRQNTTSHTSVATKKATGKGISMGWMGWPAMLAVLRGLVMKASVRVPKLTSAARSGFLPSSALVGESVRLVGRPKLSIYLVQRENFPALEPREQSPVRR